MSRISDPRTIPESERCPTDWSTLFPCELRDFWPAPNFITECADKHWRDGENLWYGTMPHSSIEQTLFDSTLGRIAGFFRGDFHRTLKPGYRAKWGTTDLPHVGIENVAKLTWLCEEFLDNDMKFDNPLCTHYDPRHNDNIIHPGGMRKVLLKLYCGPDYAVDTYYFNTGGFYDPDTMSNLEIISESEATRLHFTHDSDDPNYISAIRGCLVADHGTMIPHLMVGSTTILNRQDEFLDRVLTNIQQPDFKMFVNIEWPYHQMSWVDFLSTDPINSKIKVEVSDIRFNTKGITRVMCLALVHAMLLRPYEDHTVKITIEE